MMVRTATVQDRAIIGKALATAFAADPVIRWLMRTPAPARDAAMFRILAAQVHAAPNGADVAVEHGYVVGAALWDPPCHSVPLGQALVAAPRLLAAMRWSGFRRAIVLEAAFTKARPVGSGWYLALLGAVAPGQGVGSALLEHRLTSITGPAYTESSNPRNVPLYQRFGFDVIKEIALPEGGPTLWAMLRP